MSRADMIVREEDERGIPSRFVIKPAGDLLSLLSSVQQNIYQFSYIVDYLYS